MLIQNNNRYRNYPSSAAPQGWSVQRLYAYFMSWFQPPRASSYYGACSPYDQARYNLGMQNQWQSLNQSQCDQSDPVQTELDAQIAIKQDQLDQIQDDLDLINSNPQLEQTGEAIMREKAQGIVGGGTNNYGAGLSGLFGGGLVTYDYNQYQGYFPVLQKYRYVWEDKANAFPDEGQSGDPVGAELGKAFYYTQQFLQEQANATRLQLNTLLAQRDGNLPLGD